MNGTQALVYARSRYGSDDFDRASRQQRVLTSLREQADVANLIPRIPELLAAVKNTVRTDVPRAELAKLAGLADTIDTKNIRSYVFAYPRYGSQVLSPIYQYLPDVAKIRAAVASAFTVDPDLEATRTALAAEAASIWVLNGSSDQGRASALAGYLEYYGLIASAPTTRPPATTTTKIVVYNGAETRLVETIKFLETTLKVQVETKTDPAVRADIVITTTRTTPDLTPPPIS